MSDAYFTQKKLSMLGKSSGKLEPDADGYYELVVGGLETLNNTGSWYYTSQDVEHLFGPGSIINRRIQNGCLRAEVNHPKKTPGMSDSAYLQRNMDCDLNNVCAHFSALWLDKDFGKNHPEYNNPNLIAIMGKVKPSGAKAQLLKEALDNPKENVCFSIRAFADEKMVRGKVVRTITDVMAIDFVNEGGLLMASKWDSPKTESINETDYIMKITDDLIGKLKESSKQKALATEDSIEIIKFVIDKYDRTQERAVYMRW